MSRAGIVAIGRNEGARLAQCLASTCGRGWPVVYVDSGSTDDSRRRAAQAGADVVELDMSLPFTAARARNAGFRRLLELDPQLDFVQFLDGDCELVDGWLARASAILAERSDYAVVAGRRRERFPDHSPYNRLCDLEWDVPPGEAEACGGDALMRAAAFDQVGGFDPTLIAGEEPELCVRLRRAGWKILRTADEMTRHDADIRRFSQWRRRSVRTGLAYAAGAALHGRSSERNWVRESRSIWLWGCWLPLTAFGLAWPTHGLSLFLLVAYLVLAWRIALHCRRRGWSASDTLLVVLFTIVGKFPQFLGQMQFLRDRLLGKATPLIEYK